MSQTKVQLLNTGIDTLTDVSITTPVVGQLLRWDGSQWVNADQIDTLDELSDVSAANPANNHFLKWNGSQWVPAGLTGLGTLSDVTLTSLQSSQGIVWNGSNWVNRNTYPRRETSTVQCPMLTPFTGSDFTLSGRKTYQVLAISTDYRAWVRLYRTAEARSADTRTLPGGGAVPGMFLEIETTGFQTWETNPIPTVSSVDGNTYLRVVNSAASPAPIQVTLTVLTLEV